MPPRRRHWSGQRATGGWGGKKVGGFHINSYIKGLYWVNEYEQCNCIFIESNNSTNVPIVDSFYGDMDQTYREQCEEEAIQ